MAASCPCLLRPILVTKNLEMKVWSHNRGGVVITGATSQQGRFRKMRTSETGTYLGTASFVFPWSPASIK